MITKYTIPTSNQIHIQCVKHCVALKCLYYTFNWYEFGFYVLIFKYESLIFRNATIYTYECIQQLLSYYNPVPKVMEVYVEKCCCLRLLRTKMHMILKTFFINKLLNSDVIGNS